MKGMELAEKFFLSYGREMLASEFSSVADRIAVGLVGHGSECFGYDDDISYDHDYGPAFNMWITDDDDKLFGFKLFRAYEKLPKTFEGYTASQKSARGGNFRGVQTIENFYAFYLGGKGLPKNNFDWLSIPDYALAEATNGKVFVDKLGEFTRIRKVLLSERPQDVRLKKLASELFYMAQYGQYNYSRCMRHGETVSAGIALAEFIKSAMKAAFLLKDKYAPYYKWTFRALKELDGFCDLAPLIEKMQVSPADQWQNETLIEAVCCKIKDYLIEYGYVGNKGDYLESYAYAVNDLISDGELRNTPVML